LTTPSCQSRGAREHPADARAALWVCDRSGSAPYQRTISTGPTSDGKEVMTGSIVPGLRNTFAVGKDGALSNRYAAVLAAHAGRIIWWDW